MKKLESKALSTEILKNLSKIKGGATGSGTTVRPSVQGKVTYSWVGEYNGQRASDVDYGDGTGEHCTVIND
jgi:hypothetical protein